MSRAFTKETDDDSAAALPELPVSPHPNYVTARGLQQLQQRLAATEQTLAQLAQESSTSVDAALRQAHAQREQRWLHARLASAMLRSPSATADVVEFGAQVELCDDDDRRYRYRIVGEDEADPEHGRISWVSPLANALRGAHVGDSVVWPRPAGNHTVEILAIDNQPEPS